MLKYLARLYIKRVCQQASDGRLTPLWEVYSWICKDVREFDRESNDSTIYDALYTEFVMASKIALPFVSEGLRK